MSFGEELIHSAKDALAIARGEIEPAGVFVPEAVDVAAIRKKLRLSQAAFAERYGLPVSTLRDWEQNRRSPDRAALVLMALIDRNPQMVADTLAATQMDSSSQEQTDPSRRHLSQFRPAAGAA